MLVVVRGNPLASSSKVVGLDILSPRHPKLYSLIVSRLGLQTDPPDQVVVLNCRGELDSSCQPDSAGRQVVLAPNMYPTDVINILTETGGFHVVGQSGCGDVGDVVWSLAK
eukprot:GFUD01009977.1.p1 GENE.GFUD01009977.1~~GFUD01009977.1.p1  ORF type:complete len:111 (+),score=37.83 GFUD01009977.1:195-527(+)